MTHTIPARVDAAAKLRRSSAGFSLVETMIAIAMLGFLILAVLATAEKGMTSAVKSREQLRGSRLAQMIYSRLTTIDFYQVFACNSSQANYGLWSAYPERATLSDIQTAVKNAGFTHFTIDVTFMRRDAADSNGNGMVSDLVPFTDSNNDLVDDFDPNIKYYQSNADGDYYDTYMVGTRKIAEQPDTHIKMLVIKIWKGAQTVAIKQGELLSAEQFSGVENPSSEASLQLNIITPENGAYLYRMTTTQQTNSHNLVISKTYPSEVVAYRADATSPLRLVGETEPVATVSFYLGAPGGTVIDSLTTSMLGTFDYQSALLTNALVEGTNKFYGRTTKSTLSSPYALKQYVLDIKPPVISGKAPITTAKSRAPFVGCTFLDSGVSTDTISGICEDVLTFKSNGSTVNYRYDAESGLLVWVDSATLCPPILTEGTTYTIIVEGGDKAMYKATATWTFRVDIDDTDNSAPSVSNRTPLGAHASAMPVISCRVQDNQSGVIPNSISMTVDGVVVVSSITTPVLGTHYNASTGEVYYVPDVSYAAGTTHTVTIHAEHWATDPPDPDKRYLDPAYDVNASWSFTVEP
ncbi:MAG TPA: prepilin-type N-terminal cleavage/methylation domain-containing protein [Elusimicrobiota bacterium]|nr:prepilin-type N-terminal cleavage/methylation domain-containing protein [Elusimicrobiota bacterium]